MKAKNKAKKAEDLDKVFDEGKDSITDYVVTNNGSKKILLDIPDEMLSAIDAEAQRLGIARQAVIKFWLDLQIEQKRKAS